MNGRPIGRAEERLLAAAQRARDTAATVAGKLRTYAIVLAGGGLVAWLTWFDPWRARSTERMVVLFVALAVALLPAILVGRFAAGLAGLVGLPERIRRELAGEAGQAVSSAISAGRTALGARSIDRLGELVKAVLELRKAMAATRTTAAAIAVPLATVGIGGIAGAVAGMILGVPLLALAAFGLLVAV
jgi:hypothetical protein